METQEKEKDGGVKLTEVSLEPEKPQQQQLIAQQTAMPPVVMTQPTTHFGGLPQSEFCAACGSRGLTTLQYTTGFGTVVGSLACCLVCPPLFAVPFFLTPCKDVRHNCSNCGNVLGVKKLINI
eukprot:Seg2558.3 transcript_id=Seg2558.3/GoldUCD/mRNA.D3Y31 product="Lipopolysaccharide-induced tumor necrosis factor-alpha factor" protein_id=Seg2558.3/GoldUCD/D3Y31